MGKNHKTKVPKKKINYAVYFKNNWQLYVINLAGNHLLYCIQLHAFIWNPDCHLRISRRCLEFQEVNGLALSILRISSMLIILRDCFANTLLIECVQPALELSSTDYFGNSVKPD